MWKSQGGLCSAGSFLQYSGPQVLGRSPPPSHATVCGLQNPALTSVQPLPCLALTPTTVSPPPTPPGPATPVPTAARPMAVEPELLWAALNRRNVRWLSCYLSFGPADPCSVLLSVQSPASTGGLPASVTAHCWVSSDCGAWSLQTPCLWHQQRLPPPPRRGPPH